MAVRTVRSLQKCVRKERIIPYRRDAVDGCLQGLREFCADSVRRESRLRQKLTGSVTHAERNGRHKQGRSRVDGIHADRAEMLRLSSDAGEKFLCQGISASAVCQMHRDSGRACNRNGGIPFPGCLFTESDWNYSAYDRRNRAAVHILRIDERSAVIHRNTVWVWDDERLHPYGSANCKGFVFVMGMCNHASVIMFCRKPHSEELLVDEMLAICSEIESWREKKASEQVNAKYNEILNYGFDE